MERQVKIGIFVGILIAAIAIPSIAVGVSMNAQSKGNLPPKPPLAQSPPGNETQTPPETPGSTTPPTEAPGTPSTQYLDQTDATNAFMLHWSGMNYIDSMYGSGTDYSPQFTKYLKNGANGICGIEIAVGGGHYEAVINDPFWKPKGLNLGVALAFPNSDYPVLGYKTTGTVIFCYNFAGWMNYTIVVDMANVDLNSMANYYQIYYF